MLSIVMGVLSWAFITLNIFIGKLRQNFYKRNVWALVLEVVLATIINSLLLMSVPKLGTCKPCVEDSLDFCGGSGTFGECGSRLWSFFVGVWPRLGRWQNSYTEHLQTRCCGAFGLAKTAHFGTHTPAAPPQHMNVQPSYQPGASRPSGAPFNAKVGLARCKQRMHLQLAPVRCYPDSVGF